MGLCPPGTQATVDMRFCEPCKGDDFNLVAGGVCRPCPMGAKCTAGNRLEALPDWWCVPVRFACRPSAQASIFFVAGARQTPRPFCFRARCTRRASLGQMPETMPVQSGAFCMRHAWPVGVSRLRGSLQLRWSSVCNLQSWLLPLGCVLPEFSHVCAKC